MVFLGFCPYCGHMLLWPGTVSADFAHFYFRYCPGCRQKVEDVTGEGIFFAPNAWHNWLRIGKRTLAPMHRSHLQLILN